MTFLLSLLAIPAASAKNIEQLGSNSPGISAMWDIITNTFPHTELGEAGLLFIVLKIIDFILKIIGAVAVLVIIWAGIKMITGGEEGLTEGRKIVLYALVGLVAAMVADVVVLYVQILVNDLSL